MNSCKTSLMFSNIRKQFYKLGKKEPFELNLKLETSHRSYTLASGIPGSGAGKGGGAGGSIKESGGGLGKYGAAQEEGYFYHKDKEQLSKLKEKAKSEPAKEKEPQQKPEE